MKKLTLIIALSVAFSAYGLDIDLGSSTLEVKNTTTIQIKRLKVTGVQKHDVTFKWNSNSNVFEPVEATPSQAYQMSISAADQVNENQSTTFSASLFTDSVSAGVITPTWTATSGTITQNGVFTASNVQADTVATIRASYNHLGETLTASRNIKILNVPTPSRTCSGYLTNNSLGRLLATFTVIPDSRTIEILLTSENLNPTFHSHSKQLIQGGNAITFTEYFANLDSYTGLFVGLNGLYSGQSIPSGISKTGKFTNIPAIIDFTAPFKIIDTTWNTAVNC